MLYSQEEEFAAGLVERLLLDNFGRSLGTRRKRDESGAGGIRVDFTYDEVNPPVALEVTGLHGIGDRAAAAATQELEKRLTADAIVGQLGAWVVVIKTDASAKKLYAPVKELVQGGSEIRPGDYSSKPLLEMEEKELQNFLEMHRTLESLGLVAVERASKGRGHGVAAMVIGGGMISGFSDGLLDAIHMNAEKLKETRPRETHLAVIVYDYQASSFPSQTPPPVLPDSIDHVWVFFTWGGRPTDANTWMLRQADKGWNEFDVDFQSLIVLDEPWSEGDDGS